MKIYLDGQPLIGNKTGIGHYTNNLLKEFFSKKLPVELITNQITNKNKLKVLNLSRDNIKAKNKIYPYKAIRRLMGHNILYDFPIDLIGVKSNSIFHATNFITLPTRYAKQVVTIHDLAFMKFPEVVESNIYQYLMRWVPYSIKKADQIIADSIQTKADIIEYFTIPEDKINVVYLAADSKFKKESQEKIEIVKVKYKLPIKYLLYLGTLEPKKNITTLIDVYNQLKQKYSIEEKLVIVGTKGWKFNPIFEKIKDLHLENDVIFTGYVDDEDLPSIYSGASVFTFPSIYEGFGIPLLEAMQCEIPVVASNTSCIPEVVEDAGLLIDPYDINKWVEAIYQILINHELRMNLVQKGIEQSNKFSWEKVANETLEVYKKALKG